ncbi:MAG: hypothetical protein OEY34_11035, partial [Cyclobacteriaceae bacterium]|nr:hypothetical protein [Cyclobacteriaceae bacterium]
SSQELWLTGYKPGPPFNKVSIYVKGAIVSLMLDMTIRLYTGSRKSLDDLMLILWERIYKRGQGYSKRIIQEYAEELCGESLEGFFRDYIDGTVPVENKLDELLKVVGCTLVKSYSVISWEKNYGFKLDVENKVMIIYPGSPAQTGLSVGDTILKMNGSVPDVNLETGKVLDLDFIRSGISGTVKLMQGKTSYFPEYRINFLESRNEGQNAAFEKWVWGENY